MNKIISGCRTCLKQENNMKPLTTKWNECIEFSEILDNFIGLKDWPGTPPSICKSCETALITSYAFRNLCLETEKILKTLLINNNCDGKDAEREISSGLKPVDANFITTEKSLSNDMFTETTESNFIKDKTIIKTESNDLTISIDAVDGFDNEITKSKIVHRKSQNSVCRICNIKFNLLKDYQTHYRQMHRIRILCPLCGKLIPKTSMEKHKVSHTKAKNHLCTECGKSFTLDENLKKHWRIHMDDKRYICEHCGEKFIHWNSKRSHIRAVHTGEKNYECNICSKKFAQSSNLFRHVRQHTGELRHECHFCGKKFMSTTELRNHLVVHTKEKNEICQICNKAFGTRKTMRAHMKTHTGERNYVCRICKKAFTQAHVLRSHMKTHPDCPIPPPGARLHKKFSI